MGKLTVEEFKDGSIVRPSTSKEGWGSIMLSSDTLSIDNGLANTRHRRGFVRGSLEFLEGLGLSKGQDFNAKMKALGADECKIIVKETLEPSYEGQEPKINPTTQEQVKDSEGRSIYYNTEVVGINSGQSDSKIASGANETVNAEAQEAEKGDVA